MRIIVISLVILYLSTGVVLAEAVGKLSLAKGIIKLRRHSVDTIYQKPGTEIDVNNGDEIQTAANSLAKIRLHQSNDDIDIFSNTLFVVSNISQETSEVSMPIGKSRFLIKPHAISKKGRKRFRLKTTNALIGVKGTDFVVGVQDGNTSLLTLEGVVSLSNISEPEIEIEVKLNQASQIKQDKRPTAPIVVSPQAREAIIASDTPAGFKSVVFGTEVAPTKTETSKKKEGLKKKGEVKSESGKPQKEEASAAEQTSNENEEQVEDDEPVKDEEDIEAVEDTEAVEDIGDEDLDIPDIDMDEVLDEVEEVVEEVEEVIEETETDASEVEVIIEILE